MARRMPPTRIKEGLETLDRPCLSSPRNPRVKPYDIHTSRIAARTPFSSFAGEGGDIGRRRRPSFDGLWRRMGCGPPLPPESDCATVIVNLRRIIPAFRTPSGPPGHLPHFVEKEAPDEIDLSELRRGTPGEGPGAPARVCEPTRQIPAPAVTDACVRGQNCANRRIFSLQPRKPLKTPKTRVDKGRFSTAEQAPNDVRTRAERSPNDAEQRPNATLLRRTEGSRARTSGRRPSPAGVARRGALAVEASVDERRRPDARGDAPHAPVMSQRKLAQDLELAVALALAEQGERLDPQAPRVRPASGTPSEARSPPA